LPKPACRAGSDRAPRHGRLVLQRGRGRLSSRSTSCQTRRFAPSRLPERRGRAVVTPSAPGTRRRPARHPAAALTSRARPCGRKAMRRDPKRGREAAAQQLLITPEVVFDPKSSGSTRGAGCCRRSQPEPSRSRRSAGSGLQSRPNAAGWCSHSSGKPLSSQPISAGAASFGCRADHDHARARRAGLAQRSSP